MREHYPKLLVELSHPTDDVPEGKFDAYIHYARSRDTRDESDVRGAPGDNWICPTVGVFYEYALLILTEASVTFPTTLLGPSARYAVVLKQVSWICSLPYIALNMLRQPQRGS